MKYMILINHNQQARSSWENMSDEQRAAGYSAHASLVEDLAGSGELVVSDALADPSHAKRVTVDDGKVITADGPFPEMKEHLAGYYLVDCDSIERAVKHASRIPEAAFGLVEVRPILGSGDADF